MVRLSAVERAGRGRPTEMDGPFSVSVPLPPPSGDERRLVRRRLRPGDRLPHEGQNPGGPRSFGRAAGALRLTFGAALHNHALPPAPALALPAGERSFGPAVDHRAKPSARTGGSRRAAVGGSQALHHHPKGDDHACKDRDHAAGGDQGSHHRQPSPGEATGGRAPALRVLGLERVGPGRRRATPTRRAHPGRSGLPEGCPRATESGR